MKYNLLFLSGSRVLFMISCVMKQSTYNELLPVSSIFGIFKRLGYRDVFFIKQYSTDLKVANKVSWGTVNQLSLGKGRSSWKLLPKAEDREQQFYRTSPLTERQRFDCSPRSLGISVYWIRENSITPDEFFLYCMIDQLIGWLGFSPYQQYFS